MFSGRFPCCDYSISHRHLQTTYRFFGFSIFLIIFQSWLRNYLLLHYFMFTQNSGLTHAFILIAAGMLLTMGVLRLLRYHRSRNRSRRCAWS